jgi:hypothetical protein
MIVSGQVELFHPLPAALQTPKRHARQGLDQCRSATDPPSTSSTALPSAAGISPVDPIAPSRILQEHHEINHVGSPVESTRHFFKNASEKQSNAGSKDDSLDCLSNPRASDDFGCEIYSPASSPPRLLGAPGAIGTLRAQPALGSRFHYAEDCLHAKKEHRQSDAPFNVRRRASYFLLEPESVDVLGEVLWFALG